MSADAWGICPKCKVIGQAKWDKAMKAALDSYGKVPAADYEAAMKKARIPFTAEESLREDYEIHTDESGKFYVSYSASCQNCDFHHTFKLEKQVYP